MVYPRFKYRSAWCQSLWPFAVLYHPILTLPREDLGGGMYFKWSVIVQHNSEFCFATITLIISLRYNNAVQEKVRKVVPENWECWLLLINKYLVAWTRKPSFVKFLLGPDNYVTHWVKMRNSLEHGNSKCETKLLLKNSKSNQSLFYLHTHI